MRIGKFIIPLFLITLMAGSVIYLGMVVNNSAEAATDTATLSTDVQEYLTFSLTAGDTVAFGNLTPGTPIAAPDDTASPPVGGTIASVTTNAANGYTIGLHDGSGTNSALRHTDTTTYIADQAGTIGTPTAWVDGTTKGVGITLFVADSSIEAKWCAATCTTYNDADNKYAGVPVGATTAHTVTGYLAGADTSTWGFKVDVPNSQKTGSYSGNVTFTATAVLT